MTQIQLMGRVIKPAIFLTALVPLALLVWDGFGDELGANPVEEITHRTGEWALRFLLITLAVTPLRQLSGWHVIIRTRRMLGLFAFFYASLHFLTYAWLDHYFSLHDMVDDVIERPYITAGFVTFVLLIPLAATSMNRMIRWLGGQHWRVLHRLVYVAAAGGVLHYLWLVKADAREPLIYVVILTVLLGLRLPVLSRRLPRLRLQAQTR